MIRFVFLLCLLFRWGILHRMLLLVWWGQVVYSSGVLCVNSHSLILPRVSFLVIKDLGASVPTPKAQGLIYGLVLSPWNLSSAAAVAAAESVSSGLRSSRLLCHSALMTHSLFPSLTFILITFKSQSPPVLFFLPISPFLDHVSLCTNWMAWSAMLSRACWAPSLSVSITQFYLPL